MNMVLMRESCENKFKNFNAGVFRKNFVSTTATTGCEQQQRQGVNNREANTDFIHLEL